LFIAATGVAAAKRARAAGYPSAKPDG